MFLEKRSFLAFILASMLLDNINGQYSPECYEPGECTDSLITDLLHDLENMNACLENCQSTSDCQFFTFFEEDNSCLNLVNCINFSTDSCSDCYSGNRDCEGQCNGVLISVVDNLTENDCLDECKSTEDCSWITHDSDGGLCELLQDCQTIDTSCDTCISSEVLCSEYEPETTTSYTKLIVIGGSLEDTYIKSVEVVDLENPLSICDPIDDYPIENTAMAVGIIDGLIKSCGSAYGSDDCYDYNPSTSSWVQSTSMLDTRATPRASFIAGVWLVSGDNDDDSDKTEMWTGRRFVPGPLLPDEMYGPCQLTVNSTHVFFVDQHETRRSYLLDWYEDRWTDLPTMTMVTYSASCGLIHNPENGVEAVIVEGGRSEIFNFNTLTWREGPTLPSFDAAGYAQLMGTFVLVGGNDIDGTELDTIYQFDHINYDWILKSQKLQTARDFYPGVVAVPDYFVSCS